VDVTRPSGIAIPIVLPSAVARIRRRWDLAASLGARPHVTVLFPFLPAPHLTPAVRADLALIAATVEPFSVSFASVRPFDGVLWLEPEPAEPFRRLTAAAVGRWPDWPPYGGLFDTVIPHLTVVESATAPLDDLEGAVRAALPFTSQATHLEIWFQDPAGRWRPRWRIPLGIRS